MSDLLSRFDHWLSDSGPAALVIREYLMPVEGRDGVVFPPTYAAAENRNVFPGGYNIDNFENAQVQNVCLIDSVGSQANRIEPIFDKSNFDGHYADLVPQIVVKAGDHDVNILSAGHRAGDAIVRCSALQSDLEAAFKAILKGDAQLLAKIAPTSIVFGVWDSRETQAKLPRLISSTIRAFNVRPLHRSAQYNPALNYEDAQLLPEAKPGSKEDKAYSERGYKHNPATWSHGGVIAEGGIRRDATLSLAALRQSCTTPDKENRLKLQRYILGLALTSFTFASTGYLRQGCNLVLDPDRESERVEVYGDGTRKPLSVTHSEAVEYAKAAAKAFGVGESRTVPFDKKLAEKDAKSKKS